MFGIGGFELFLIVLFAFLLFGPEKIPVFLKTLRKAVVKFREAEQEVTSALKQEVIDPETGETAADVFDSLTGKAPAKGPQRSASSKTFAERKAQHERERAEREKAAVEAAEKAAASASAAAAVDAVAADSGEPQPPEARTDKPEAVPASASAADMQEASASVQTTIGGLSLEELYATKPVEAQAVAAAASEPATAQDIGAVDASESGKEA